MALSFWMVLARHYLRQAAPYFLIVGILIGSERLARGGQKFFSKFLK
jgi:hypothetical protein